ncbi:MAG: ferritin-like protein [Acidobacteriota bacterium]|nr:ferritin-like protein [Acidobacteriota bacterium]
MQKSSLDNLINPAVIEVEAPDEPDIIIGSREQIFHLLAEAAEIEHTLMCSYLYAAFSLKDGSESGFSKQKTEAVGQWRKTIRPI